VEINQTYFIDVILPLSVPLTYTYRVQKEYEVELEIGKRVLVQFGKKKMYGAIIQKIHYEAPQNYQAKYIEEVIDQYPVVNSFQLKLWEWIANYYMCHIGEVMLAALPAGLRLSSETKVLLHPDFEGKTEHLNDKEFLIVEALQQQPILNLFEIESIVNQKTVLPIVKHLINLKIIVTEEDVKTQYRPKKISYIQLTEHYCKEESLKLLMDKLQKAPKQLQLLMTFLKISDFFTKGNQAVEKLVLQNQSQSNASQVNELVKKDIFKVYEREINRTNIGLEENLEINQLSDYQIEKLNEILAHFEQKDVTLLQGVTSSGKTEIYFKLIEKIISEDKQVLFLMPEIALTTQMISRLTKRFGEKVAVYHSKFSTNERVDVWRELMEGNKLKIILGARSSLFLPFKNLGLIIIDEEHESTFKQMEPAPRYHARDTAIMYASFFKSKVLLGSATPSIESYYNAKEQKYGMVEMTKRFGDMQMPEILVADIKEAKRKRKMTTNFSPMLLEHIEKALEEKKQVILFQNRRGFSPYLQCETCGWILYCSNCDVSMTYHKFSNLYKCHYCGASKQKVHNCGACGDTQLTTKGFGTEKIEEELAVIFPKAVIARMDLDTTKSKNSYFQLINDFEQKKTDILVGTQMVTKGLDFDNVALVGVLSADSLLSFPDFRAFERSFQLMAQVSGRAGRKNERGKVIIQTYQPEHPIILDVIANDYKNMYRNEMIDRRNFLYPPICRMIILTLKDRDKSKVDAAAQFLAQLLKSKLGNAILGPEYPTVGKVRNLYLKNITIKITDKNKLSAIKGFLKQSVLELKQHKTHKSVYVLADVDPQ
jgi:primosomal protein N' (replication factor Y) (superfamily II helicase)